jgi:hypothetical protein
MNDPGSYSKFYNQMNQLGLMQEKKYGGIKFDKGGPTNPNSNPDQVLTYKDNPEWFDNRAIYSGDDRYDAQIRKLVYEGKGGYNPHTRTLHFLKPDQQTKVDETTKAYSKDKRTQTAEDKKLIASDAGKKHILNTAEDFVQKSALATAALAAPLALPSGSAVMGALEAPLVIGGTAVPGVTAGGTLGAAFGGMGINEFANPNEETNKSIRTAYNNPTYENVRDASINSAISGTNFLGLGMLNEAKPLVKNAAQILGESKYSKLLKSKINKNNNVIELNLDNIDDLPGPPVEQHSMFPSSGINLSKNNPNKTFKPLIDKTFNKKSSILDKSKRIIIDALDNPKKYITDADKEEYKNLARSFSTQNADRNIFDNDNLYKLWGESIYPGLGEIATPTELRTAHANALEYFKDYPFVTMKELGLHMRNQLADKVVDFKLPQFTDAKGISFLSDIPNSIAQIKNPNKQAKTIKEALRKKIYGTSTKILTPEEAKAIIESESKFYESSSKHYGIPQVNKSFSDANLTPEERSIIHAYAKGYDSSINGVARSGKVKDNTTSKFYQEQGEKLKNILLKNKIDSKEFPTVIRGVSNHSVELVDPVTHMPTGEVINKSELQEGQMFIDRGFVSTTYDKYRGFGSADASEIITIPEGKVLSGFSPNSLNHSSFASEREIILPPNLIRRIDKIHFGEDQRFATSIVNPYKLGGKIKNKKCYTCNNSKMKVLYNKANYKK